MILNEAFILCLSAFVQGVPSSSASLTCSNEQFVCDNGEKCLPKTWVCDGSPDCNDKTDEMEENCAKGTSLHPKCKSTQFKCANGLCMPYRWTCDGTDDCGDGSDEVKTLCSTEVTCKDSEFQCGNDQCISSIWKCDGHSDCFDGSDEANCPVEDKTEKASSNSSEFRCSDGFPIPENWICDGEKDCQTGEDEQKCENIHSTNKTDKLPDADKRKQSGQAFDKKCRSNEFMCPHSYCILNSWKCDGSDDCINGEDELNCEVIKCDLVNQFSCKDGKHCISDFLRCDTVKHCADGSDEDDCPIKQDPTTIPTIEVTTQPISSESSCKNETEFRCNNGKCISKGHICDGQTDCPNREDESRTLCGIDECKRNNGGCEQICVNTIAAHECQCKKGYFLVGKYTCSDINECRESPGICSQVCTNTEGSFHCSCLSGYTREPSNYTRCKASEGDIYLLFSHSYDIRLLRLRDKEMSPVVQHTRRATALDYSFEKEKILWADEKEKKIYRARIGNTTDREVLVDSDEISADGLAVDWIHNHVYFTDKQKSAIKLLSWDAKYTKTIVTEEVGHPRAIVVSPQNGYIYWTDWGTDAKIERSSLNGLDRKAIVSNPHVVWPNGLVIDHSTEKIYWCDGRLRTISSANLDGSNAEVILYSPFFLRHPFSISVFEDRLYWTDWSQVALFSADKFTGSNIQNVTAGHLLESPKVVHVYHQYRQPKTANICAQHSCAHFCLRSPIGEVICDCADGFQLQEDKLACIETALLNRESFLNKTHEEELEVEVVVEKLRAEEKRHEGVSNSRVGFIVGSLVGGLFGIGVLFGVYLAWTKNRTRPIQRIRFNNSVYRKTISDDQDGRGYVIDHAQVFCSQSARRNQIDQHFIDADDAPLTPPEDDDDDFNV